MVALLFTDLVGSTELLERLGDDAAEELRHTHFSLLRQAVSGAGGYEVKSLGDGLMVAFTSAVQAVGCAVTMQRAVAEHNRVEPGRALHVRVGLHVGEPARDEDDLFGTSVVVAKRLCDAARGGQILASELVAGLVGSRGGFRFDPAGTLSLKGLARALPAVTVEWELASMAPSPAPPASPPARPSRADGGVLGERLRESGVTRREGEVLAAVAGRLSNAEIAARLFVSERTVESHVSSLLRKLGVSTRSALVELGRSVTRAAPQLDPLPPFLRALVERGPFVGRGSELAGLRRAWDEAGSGLRRVVFVVGEAGIGKSRLTAQLAADVEAGGGTVLFGRCDEEALVPYQPFTEAVERLVSVSPPGLLEGVLTGSGAELSRVLPRLAGGRDDSPASSADGERYRVFEAVDELLTRAWNLGPVLLVLDDLHWADRPTLLLLKHLARHPGRSGLLVVGTYRDEDFSRGHPLAELLVELRREHGFARLCLAGLSAEELDALMGRDPQPTGAGLFAEALREVTEGNPFFVHEMLQHLEEVGALERVKTEARPGLAIQALGVPAGVLDLVGRRLAHLEAIAHQVLSTASAMGQVFSLDLLGRVTGSGEDQLLESLEAALVAALIEETPGQLDSYRFRHALIREVLYREIPTSRRARLHRRIGEALEACGEDHLPELAHHFWAAGPAGDAERAVTYAERAGEQAVARLAYEPAAALYGMALEALSWNQADTEPKRAELLRAQGEAHRRRARRRGPGPSTWKLSRSPVTPGTRSRSLEPPWEWAMPRRNGGPTPSWWRRSRWHWGRWEPTTRRCEPASWPDWPRPSTTRRVPSGGPGSAGRRWRPPGDRRTTPLWRPCSRPGTPPCPSPRGSPSVWRSRPRSCTWPRT
jgi:class 3 adenylate cyclase/DNA-binding CsgD family transcriptional regulator